MDDFKTRDGRRLQVEQEDGRLVLFDNVGLEITEDDPAYQEIYNFLATKSFRKAFED